MVLLEIIVFSTIHWYSFKASIDSSGFFNFVKLFHSRSVNCPLHILNIQFAIVIMSVRLSTPGLTRDERIVLFSFRRLILTSSRTCVVSVMVLAELKLLLDPRVLSWFFYGLNLKFHAVIVRNVFVNSTN